MSNMIRLTLTCTACPEQYDATLDGNTVGYLRLRHSVFTVHCPDVGGELVYHKYTKGDGAFEDDEYKNELNNAVLAIYKWLADQDVPLYETEGEIHERHAET